MKIHTAPQGTPDWHIARAGCITASNYKMIRAKVNGLTAQQKIYVDAVRAGSDTAVAMALAEYKSKPRAECVERAIAGHSVGEFSDTAKNYAFRLAIERISRMPLNEGFETWAMARGKALEPLARQKHEIRSGVLVEEVGFVTTDDGKFGASADGFIDDDDGAEYKCFISPEKLREIYLTGDTTEVIDQCMGGMWITGRKRWHFGLYCPALESIGLDFELHLIERDDDYIEAMEEDLVEFDRLVTGYEMALRAKAAGQPIDAAPWEGASQLAKTAPVIAAATAAVLAGAVSPSVIPENIFA